MLNQVSNEVVEHQYLAEDNFTFLLRTKYPPIIKDFKERFTFLRRVEYDCEHENNIFTEPASQIDLQVLNFIVPDYAVPAIQNQFNVTISLHNNARNRTPNRHPSRVMVEAINVIGNYVLEHQIPHFLPYYEFDFRNHHPTSFKIPRGFEEYFLKSP